MKTRPITRRAFITRSGLAAAGTTLGANALSAGVPREWSSPDTPWDIYFFSKHLQFLDYREAAEACALAGMKGADLTVRPGGHVLPENVERDLPRAVQAFREAGLDIVMMATGITDPEDPLTGRILQTASDLGIRYYRMGYYHYDEALPVVDNLERIKVRVNGLARLNEQYGIHGAYQNHAGNYFGAAVWDLWEVIRELDPQWTGCQYDIRHATLEGPGTWPLGLRLLKDHIRCLVVKDFTWNMENGRALEVNVPIGEGLVDFKSCFRLLEELRIHGPVTMHLEYEMFPDREMTTAEMKDHAIGLMKKDLKALQQYL